MGYSVAIDGPAGAGKSTIAKKVAEELGFIYVDTGAMYRAMALYLYQQGVQLTDQTIVEACCQQADISIGYEQGEQIVLLDGKQVNQMIRQEEIGRMASVVAANVEVRKKLVALQQKMAESQSVIMDGRDIGTCVLPKANVKIFLTASSQVRAKRRFDELQAKGEDCLLEQIEEDIIHRDKQDMERKISPLKQAEDAIVIDSSEMSIGEVVQRIKELIKEDQW